MSSSEFRCVRQDALQDAERARPGPPPPAPADHLDEMPLCARAVRTSSARFEASRTTLVATTRTVVGAVRWRAWQIAQRPPQCGQWKSAERRPACGRPARRAAHGSTMACGRARRCAHRARRVQQCAAARVRGRGRRPRAPRPAPAWSAGPAAGHLRSARLASGRARAFTHAAASGSARSRAPRGCCRAPAPGARVIVSRGDRPRAGEVLLVAVDVAFALVAGGRNPPCASSAWWELSFH